VSLAISKDRGWNEGVHAAAFLAVLEQAPRIAHQDLFGSVEPVGAPVRVVANRKARGNAKRLKGIP
jgi:hypothetical protein